MAHIIIAARGGRNSKSRCREALCEDSRGALTRAMLADMIVACRRAPGVERVWVVTPSTDLASLAAVAKAMPIFETEVSGLGEAFAVARKHAEAAGPAPILLLPGDLPLLDPFDIEAVIAAPRPDEAVLVAANGDGGTGAILLPPGAPFSFAYGPNSFARHLAAARASGLTPRVVDAPSMAFDLDRPSDIARILAGNSGGRTRALLASFALFKDVAA